MYTRKLSGLLALLLLLLTTAGSFAAPADRLPTPVATHTTASQSAQQPADAGAYHAIKMVSASDGWIVGDGGLIKHYAHGYWLDYPSPVTTTLEAVDANSNDAWIVGDDNTVLRLVGATWQPIEFPAPPTSTLSSVSIVAPGEVWMLGHTAATPLLLHYDNGSVTLGPTPPTDGQISWASPNEAWLVNGSSIVYHFIANQWQPLNFYTTPVESVFMLSPTVGWMGLNYVDLGEGTLTQYLSYDGQYWRVWPCDGWSCTRPLTPATPSGKSAPDCNTITYDTYALSAITTTEFYAAGNIVHTDCVSQTITEHYLWDNVVPANYPDGNLGQPDDTLIAISTLRSDSIWGITAHSIYHWDGISLTPTPTCNNPYADIPASYYVLSDIEYLTCRGIVAGTAAHTFSPDAPTTRMQFAKLVALAQGWQLATPTTQTFTDVPASNPLYAFVETAYAHGAIQGVDAGNCATNHAAFPCFLPNAPVTRAQAATIVQRAFAWPLDTSGGQIFSDVPPNYYAYAEIETCYHHGIINGVGNGQFAPDQSIARSQIAAILYRALTNP